MNHTIKIICLSLIGLMSLSGCAKLERKKAEREVLLVEVRQAGDLSAQAVRTYVGEIRSAEEMPLYYPLGGELTALYVKNGDHVVAGTHIADIDSTQAYSLFLSARAVLQQAEDGYKRLQAVYEKGVVSDVQWVEMQTNLEKAQQSEIAARKQLANCHLTAPVAGVISGLNVYVGQQLMPGQTVCQLMNIGKLEVAFSVPEQDIANIQIGREVQVEVTAVNYKASGVIVEKNVSANPIAHTYTIRAALSMEGPLPGMVAKVHIATAEEQNEHIILPGRCIQTTPNGHVVWVVNEGKAERRAITVTGYAAEGVEVSEGLSRDDLVVVAGYQKLYSGAEVRYE